MVIISVNELIDNISLLLDRTYNNTELKEGEIYYYLTTNGVYEGKMLILPDSKYRILQFIKIDTRTNIFISHGYSDLSGFIFNKFYKRPKYCDK